MQVEKTNILSNLSDAEIDQRVKKAVSLDLEKKKALKAPIAVFDEQDQKVRLIDCSGKILAERPVLKKGKYSERVKYKT